MADIRGIILVLVAGQAANLAGHDPLITLYKGDLENRSGLPAACPIRVALAGTGGSVAASSVGWSLAADQAR